MSNTKSEPQYKPQTLIINMIYQYELSDCHKCTTVVGDVDDRGDGGGVHVWGQGRYGKSGFSLHFPCEFKTALKNNFFFF